MLSPIEQEESQLDDDYLRRHLDGRLASRHFRNQLRLLQQEASDYDEFLRFCRTWLPELELEDLRYSHSPDGINLDLFYREVGIRLEKELFWAGDGIQVWLQLLLHVFRNRRASALVLDEPDLYLHADLQRRLVQLLESLGCQSITATHPAEILAEAGNESIIWVDKSRRSAVSRPKETALGELSASIGSSFNLRLAKALRARVVLFVEGDDMKILRHVARTIGATELANEVSIAVVPLGGYSNWGDVEPFRWLNEKLLKASVQEFVLLDRDYRSDSEARSTVKKLKELGIEAHIWKRKELESYLLHPDAIARISGADRPWVAHALRQIANEMEYTVSARILVERQQRGRKDEPVQVAERAQRDFKELWADEPRRIELCPAKAVLAELNKLLESEGHGAVSMRALARALLPDEVPTEMVVVLLRINEGQTG